MQKKTNDKPLGRIEVIYIKSATLSLPNGDGDTGAPRTDAYGHLLVSPGSEKHHERMYALNVLGENVIYRPGHVRDKYFIDMSKREGDLLTNLCEDAYDLRLSGVTVTGLKKALSATGALQKSWGRSYDPVSPRPEPITCCAPATTNTVKGKKEGDADVEKPTGVMGTSWIVPFALYPFYEFFSPTHAHRPRDPRSESTAEFRGTGATREDLDKHFEAVFYAPEHTRSAGRTGLVTERMFVFEHDSVRGNGQAHKLFKRIKVTLRDGVESPSCTEDYVIEVDSKNLPKGVTMWEYYLDDDGDVARKQLK